MEIKLEGLTLMNVSEGALEERFQELLADVTEVNGNAMEYVGNSNGERTSKIVLEVDIRFKPSISGDPATTLIISGAELKRPKKMKTAQAAYSRDGVLLVEHPNGAGKIGLVKKLAVQISYPDLSVAGRQAGSDLVAHLQHDLGDEWLVCQGREVSVNVPLLPDGTVRDLLGAAD